MLGRFYFPIFILFFLSGCASIRNAVPENLTNSAQVMGIPYASRAFWGQPNSVITHDYALSLKQDTRDCFSIDNDGNKIYSVLVISSGAENGAFGSGLLKGWTHSGSRPVFKIVTGVSTGAIIAPFAFLGSAYDQKLEEIYTTHSTKNVFRSKIIPLNSLVKNWPIARLIDKYYDKQLLQEIAKEYYKGRRLYIGTTNLDAQQMVVWNMGEIASVGNDQALAIFRKIILASVSMPGAFPPVYFQVKANGKIYKEMDMDGGLTKQVFLPYEVLKNFIKTAAEIQRGMNSDSSRLRYKLYIIRNTFSDPIWKSVSDNILSIVVRTIDTIIKAQTIGDIYQLYAFAKLGRGDFYLASIPTSYIRHDKEFFDRVEMKRLFDLGFKEASRGYHWRKSPLALDE
jgi:hypothetical protein